MKIFPGYEALTSGKIARERTWMTIASDRLSCSPDELRQLRKELEDVLSKYMNFAKEPFEIRMDIVYETERGVQDVKTIQIK